MYSKRKQESKQLTFSTQTTSAPTAHHCHDCETVLPYFNSFFQRREKSAVCRALHTRQCRTCQLHFPAKSTLHLHCSSCRECLQGYINFEDNAHTFQPFKHTLLIVYNLTWRAEAESLQAPFMEVSEDFYEFLILQASFLPNVSAPAGYVLLAVTPCCANRFNHQSETQ